MAPVEGHDEAGPGMSPTALAAILTGAGVVLLGGIIVLAVALWMARRTHNRLLADLDQRGVAIAQSQAQDHKRTLVTKPKTVLKRNQALPFNATSGWGALPSAESVNLAEPDAVPPHYAPPKPAGFVSKSRLSWPFSGRRGSSKAMRMKKLRVSVLSTVVESPKPSPLVPVLSGALPHEDASSRKSDSRPSSDQILLEHHPALREAHQVEDSLAKDEKEKRQLRRSSTTRTTTNTVIHVKPERSNSMAAFPISPEGQPDLSGSPSKRHTRSPSTSTTFSGHAPDAPMPPLPLDVSRLKGQDRITRPLHRSPSRVSVSSHESGHSSILATQSSPTLHRPSNVRVQKSTRRDWRRPTVDGPRPFRDTLALHGMNQTSRSPTRNGAARSTLGSTMMTHIMQEKRNSIITNSSSTQSMKVRLAESVTLSKVSSPSSSPLTMRHHTPKRRSGCSVNAFGSPEQRPKTYAGIGASSGVLKRQLSQASTQASSTRSSYGNPFQWDTQPLSSGKPSALKGSPSARKGHRRQSKVRLSLQPVILGPPSEGPAAANMQHHRHGSSPTRFEAGRRPDGASDLNKSLPRPPSSATFAPDVKLTATTIRASLAPGSHILAMANYEHDPDDSSNTHTMQTSAGAELPDNNVVNEGSPFTIPKFPSPCHGPGPTSSEGFAPPVFTLLHGEDVNRGVSSAPRPEQHVHSPFDEYRLPDVNLSPIRPMMVPQYDPEQPGLIFETPRKNVRSLPFATIPEESSAASTRALYSVRMDEDSPPCSPKSLPRNPAFQPRQDSLNQQPTYLDPSLDTIDPALLNKDAFNILNQGFDPDESIMHMPNPIRNGPPMPSNPSVVRRLFEPLIEAALPSSPPEVASTTRGDEFRASLYLPPAQPSPTSLYSYASLPSSTSLSPGSLSPSPCSPRPAHAQLPPPTLNFTHIPDLSPNIAGPRGGPASPLRTSIAKLRRMNSVAEEEGKEIRGRGERRYLKLGREASIALPGDESLFDELDCRDDAGVRESILEWEEGVAFLDLEDEGSVPGHSGNKDTDHCDDSRKDTVEPLNISPFKNRPGSRPPLPTTRELPVPFHHKPTPSSSSVSSQVAPESSSRRGRSGPHSDSNRNSSIWEDGEKFWDPAVATSASPPRHSRAPSQAQSPRSPRARARARDARLNTALPPNSPNKPSNPFVPLASPNATPRCKPRKPQFRVARDQEENQDWANHNTSPMHSRQPSNGGIDFDGRDGAEARLEGRASPVRTAPSTRLKKRSALGIGTPNVGVRIMVQPPSGERGAGVREIGTREGGSEERNGGLVGFRYEDFGDAPQRGRVQTRGRDSPRDRDGQRNRDSPGTRPQTDISISSPNATNQEPRNERAETTHNTDSPSNALSSSLYDTDGFLMA